MLNEKSITDQKIAVGLVENPCCWALEALAAHVPADEVAVEIGAYRGRTTGWLAMGAQGGNGARVVSIDPHEQGEIPDGYSSAPSVPSYVEPSTREAYLAHLDETGVAPFVDYVQATSTEAAKEYDGPKVGLLWVDGLHDYDNAFADLKSWLPKMAKDAVVVLHDVDDQRYPVMEAAQAAFTRTKTLRETWDFDGVKVHPWPKNNGRAPEDRRRGFAVIYSKASTYPVLEPLLTSRITK